MLDMLKIYFGVLIALYSYETIRETRGPFSFAEHLKFCVSLIITWLIIAMVLIFFGVE